MSMGEVEETWVHVDDAARDREREREWEFERHINRSAPKIRQQIYMQNEHDTQVNHQEKQ